MDANHRSRTFAVMAMALIISAKTAVAQRPLPTLLPGQRTVQVRDPSQLVKYRIQDSAPPPTVSSKGELEAVPVSLDEVIRISLDRTDVVRILAGTTAVSSGRSIYDAAIINTTIDQSNARFDPVLSSSNTFNTLESPQAIFNPLVPGQTLINGIRTDGFTNSTNLTKLNALGGTAGLGFGSIRGVMEAYWSLVAARTDVWSKQQQIEQLEEVVRRIKTRVKVDLDNRADLSQVQVTLANTRAALITSRANMIQREDALRNLIGMPPSDGKRLVPHTPPTDERFEPDWSRILEIASERRPDLIELKLIIEADEQQIVIAKNSALPQLDGVALYRWNGLEGTTPAGAQLQSGAGANTDWTLGVNFSVPLGLRQSRAGLRQRELTIVRDRINLQQGLHQASHLLATNLRTLDQSYELYLAFREVREAAKTNLDYQLAKYRTGTGILINVLQGVTDWGNAISNEANSLANYNTTLATLERQTGTILETHGVYFYEERYGSIGPLGCFVADVCYTSDTRPTTNEDRYLKSNRPAEEKFELEQPFDLKKKPANIDYDNIDLPTLEESLDSVPPEPDGNPTDVPPNPSPDKTSRRDRVDSEELTASSRIVTLPLSGDVVPANPKPKSLRQRVSAWFPR